MLPANHRIPVATRNPEEPHFGPRPGIPTTHSASWSRFGVPPAYLALVVASFGAPGERDGAVRRIVSTNRPPLADNRHGVNRSGAMRLSLRRRAALNLRAPGARSRLAQHAVLVAGSVLLGLAMYGATGAAPPAPPPVPAAPQPSWTLPGFIDNAHKLVQIAAIITAGVWAYYQFFRGRTFRPRLEPAIEAAVLQFGDSRYLKIKLRVKNVGLSNVPIDRDASGLRVFTSEARADSDEACRVLPVVWRRERTIGVLSDHAWIESGETVEDTLLLSLPESQAGGAYRVEVKLAGCKTDWYASAVADMPSERTVGPLTAALARLLS